MAPELTEPASIERCAAEVASRAERLDILLNNAGAVSRNSLQGFIERHKVICERPCFREGIQKLFRIDSLICRAQPEAMDEPLKVSAPHERVFRTALMVLLPAMVGLVAVTA